MVRGPFGLLEWLVANCPWLLLGLASVLAWLLGAQLFGRRRSGPVGELRRILVISLYPSTLLGFTVLGTDALLYALPTSTSRNELGSSLLVPLEIGLGGAAVFASLLVSALIRYRLSSESATEAEVS